MDNFRIAILDLYEGEPNEGMRCICQLVSSFAECSLQKVTFEVFDVRSKLEMADLSFDAFISSGGPGSPLTSEGSEWETKYFRMMDEIHRHNDTHPQQKSVLLICHSFQLYCRQFGYAKVSKRKSTAFGVMPVHLTTEGKRDLLFRSLDEPFYAVDSRDFQVTDPSTQLIAKRGGHILCLEKERPHIALPRAVMAIRFDRSFIGMQFHPEADPEGMHRYLIRDDKREAVVKRYGLHKYEQMLQHLNDPEKIRKTYQTILPAFLNHASRTNATSYDTHPQRSV